MINSYIKGNNVVLSNDFESHQFDCHCEDPECNVTLIDSDLIAGLQQLMWRYPIITVNSGFRCLAHNHLIGGEPGSYHLQGKAADIRSPFAKPEDLGDSVEEIECFKQGGIGRYGTFIHCDVRNVGRPARWRG